jgi:hypothetical protein
MTSTRGAFPKIAKCLQMQGLRYPSHAGGSVDTTFADSMDFAIYADGPEVGSTVLQQAKAGKSGKRLGKRSLLLLIFPFFFFFSFYFVGTFY